jgi:hypothetical protein
MSSYRALCGAGCRGGNMRRVAIAISALALATAAGAQQKHLIGEGYANGSLLCKYDDGSVLNVGYPPCPVTIGGSNSKPDYTGGYTSSIDSASQRVLQDAQSKLLEAQTKALQQQSSRNSQPNAVTSQPTPALAATPHVGMPFDECFQKCKQYTSRTNEQCFDSCKSTSSGAAAQPNLAPERLSGRDNDVCQDDGDCNKAFFCFQKQCRRR